MNIFKGIVHPKCCGSEKCTCISKSKSVENSWINIAIYNLACVGATSEHGLRFRNDQSYFYDHILKLQIKVKYRYICFLEMQNTLKLIISCLFYDSNP